MPSPSPLAPGPAVWLALGVLMATGVPAAESLDLPAARELGRRLFREARFSAPRGDFSTSCQTCHLFDEDPQGLRAHTDFLSRSWIAWRREDPRREHARNSPSLLDAGTLPVLHSDGEFTSLEDLVLGTLAGRTFGWLPDEEAEARSWIVGVIQGDPGAESDEPPYAELFRRAYDIDPGRSPAAEVLDGVARAVAEHVRTLEAPRNSPYDRFLDANGLAGVPAAQEPAEAYARRLLRDLALAESGPGIRFVPGFSPQALDGLKLFLRVPGSEEGDGADASPVGNCVACHPPPDFTDHSFHNVGASQGEYDQVHGAGSFARLEIAAGSRPVPHFQAQPQRRWPQRVDLGHWNFADPSSPLRRSGEGAEAFLRRMVGTFKTPTLRNLAYSHPYLHNGVYPTVRETLEAKLEWSRMARRGELRSADEELLGMALDDDAVSLLVTFLASLGDELKPGLPAPDLRQPVPDSYAPDNYPRF